MPRRPQKRTAERRRQRPQSPIAIDPLVGPGNPPHRHPPCAKTDQPRSRRCMVHLATRTSSHRSKSSYQAKYATVMLALQLPILGTSESMGHHDSEIMDDGGLDRVDAGALGVVAARGEGSDAAFVHAGACGGVSGIVSGRALSLFKPRCGGSYVTEPTCS